MIDWTKLNETQAEDLESYLALRLFEHDIENCHQVLQRAMDNRENKSLVFPMLMSAVVSYGRPFKTSYGNFAKHKLLKEDWVPTESHPLHDQLIGYRDTLLAHTDIRAKGANLMLDKSPQGKAQVLMSFRPSPYDALLSQIESIHALAKAVQKNLMEGWVKKAEMFERDYEFWKTVITGDLVLFSGTITKDGVSNTVDLGVRKPT